MDFKSLVTKKVDIDYSNLITVFESLDRQSSHTDLRKVQYEALEQLNKILDNRDIVLKSSTGTGKTTIALLYLYSMMKKSRAPSVYFCPTNQLLNQVNEEASKLGIPVTQYLRGCRYPELTGTRAQAIILCTYDKLFNALSTFNRTDVLLRPASIVCDDAHAGIEEIRDAFCLRILKDHDCYSKICALFEDDCIEYNASAWRDVISEDYSSPFEIPFWYIKSKLSELESILLEYREDDNFKFTWGFIKDIIRWSRISIAGNCIEIIPEILPISKVEAFTNASHRLFLSATLSDDSLLAKELGVESISVQNPIIPASDRGLGERLIIAPSLSDPDLDKEWVMSYCQEIASTTNIVVLSSSEQAANQWLEYGANVVMGDDFEKALETLRKERKGSFFVFVQRYDGVNLPDDTCRIIVLDGLPKGENLSDKIDGAKDKMGRGVRNKTVFRIEQGMGRAVRSHADYAVVILAGSDICNYVARKNIQEIMNTSTQAQMNIALELADIIRKKENGTRAESIKEMIMQALQRDSDWKQYYADRMEAFFQGNMSNLTSNVQFAAIENKAFNLVLNNNIHGAVQELRTGINNLIPPEEKVLKSIALQRVANYIYEYNEGEGFQVQQVAYQETRLVFCPPEVIQTQILSGKFISEQAIFSILSEYGNQNGILSRLKELKGLLIFSNSAQKFENGIELLGSLLGCESLRPEKKYKNGGSDNLWIWEGIPYIIEVKNRNHETIHKSDVGQLLHSLTWFDNNYPQFQERYSLIVSKINIIDHDVECPSELRILTKNGLEKLLKRLEDFYSVILNESLTYNNPTNIRTLLSQQKLLMEQFFGNFCEKPIKK